MNKYPNIKTYQELKAEISRLKKLEIELKTDLVENFSKINPFSAEKKSIFDVFWYILPHQNASFLGKFLGLSAEFLLKKALFLAENGKFGFLNEKIAFLREKKVLPTTENLSFSQFLLRFLGNLIFRR